MTVDKEKLSIIVSYFSFAVSQRFPFKIKNVQFYNILYLADWHYAIRAGKGKTITDVTWQRGSLGPYSMDLAEVLCQYHGMKNKEDVRKASVLEDMELRFMGAFALFDKLQGKELDALDHVIRIVGELNGNVHEMTRLVCGTMPFIDVDINAVLDISKIALQHAKIHRYFDDSWHVPDSVSQCSHEATPTTLTQDSRKTAASMLGQSCGRKVYSLLHKAIAK